jgi:hypothetical protein
VKPFTAAPATEMTALPTFAPSARAPQRAPTPNSEIRTTR